MTTYETVFGSIDNYVKGGVRTGCREIGFQVMRDYAQAKSARIDVDSQVPLFCGR